MMGSPFYYDVSYDQGDIIYHDCMWSGDCTCCIQLVTDKTIPTKLDIEIKQSITHFNNALNNGNNISSHQIIQQHDTPTISIAATTTTTVTTTPTTTTSTSSTSSTTTTTTTTAPAAPEATSPAPVAPIAKSKSISASKLSSISKLNSISKSTLTSRQSQAAKSSSSTGSSSSSSSTSSCLSSSSSGFSTSFSSSSADNKKLRHREVEKNRHRQLQAMVKTLSERIPGRLDKETQVQTMKRAARYCVYLRDVLITLSHGQGTLNKDKLEKIYRRSCDNVDLIMSQQ